MRRSLYSEAGEWSLRSGGRVEHAMEVVAAALWRAYIHGSTAQAWEALRGEVDEQLVGRHWDGAFVQGEKGERRRGCGMATRRWPSIWCGGESGDGWFILRWRVVLLTCQDDLRETVRARRDAAGAGQSSEQRARVVTLTVKTWCVDARARWRAE